MIACSSCCRRGRDRLGRLHADRMLQYERRAATLPRPAGSRLADAGRRWGALRRLPSSPSRGRRSLRSTAWTSRRRVRSSTPLAAFAPAPRGALVRWPFGRAAPPSRRAERLRRRCSGVPLSNRCFALFRVAMTPSRSRGRRGPACPACRRRRVGNGAANSMVSEPATRRSGWRRDWCARPRRRARAWARTDAAARARAQAADGYSSGAGGPFSATRDTAADGPVLAPNAVADVRRRRRWHVPCTFRRRRLSSMRADARLSARAGSRPAGEICVRYFRPVRADPAGRGARPCFRSPARPGSYIPVHVASEGPGRVPDVRPASAASRRAHVSSGAGRGLCAASPPRLLRAGPPSAGCQTRDDQVVSSGGLVGGRDRDAVSYHDSRARGPARLPASPPWWRPDRRGVRPPAGGRRRRAHQRRDSCAAPVRLRGYAAAAPRAGTGPGSSRLSLVVAGSWPSGLAVAAPLQRGLKLPSRPMS